MSAPKNCQTGWADFCKASQQDGVACPHDSCDIDDGIRKDAPTQGADARPVAIYQIAFSDEDGWCDTYQKIYESHPEHMRRIVYAAPVVPPMTNAMPVAEVGENLVFILRNQDNGERWPAGTKLYVTRDAAPSKAISDVLAERERQDAQWGGQDHDDQHTKADWQNYIYRQHYAASSFCGTPEQYRVRLVKIAALAVAAIESIDRIAASAPREKT